MVRQCEGRGVDPYYAAYFEYFNRGEYYEAHDVLEQLWLPIRKQPEGAFYKGLIQLAGAFVHLQKNRPGPAAALFKLARHNIASKTPVHERLDVGAVLALIDQWLTRVNPSTDVSIDPTPKLELMPAS